MRTQILGLLFSALTAATSCSHPSSTTTTTNDTAGVVAQNRVPVDGLPAIGGERPLVTMVAFVDYECPFSARADKTMAALRAAYGDDLRIVVASRPLPMHSHARAAALAALAADEQGRFAAMHAQLYATAELDEAGLQSAARAAGLDPRRFGASRASARTEAALDRAETLAQSLDVTGTPTFLIDGRRIEGAQPEPVFRELIDAELGRARALVASGVPRDQLYARLVADAPPKAESPSTPCPAEEKTAPKVERIPIDHAPARGPDRAPVTIVVFTDFECPYCAKLDARLRDLEVLYPGRVRLVYKAHPLPMHAHAKLAARAAAAADAQGKFWPFYERLFSHQKALDRAALDAYAADAGLDLDRFANDLADARTGDTVAADLADGDALGVTGTPTLFVNGRRLTGARPMTELVDAVDRALADSR